MRGFIGWAWVLALGITWFLTWPSAFDAWRCGLGTGERWFASVWFGLHVCLMLVILAGCRTEVVYGCSSFIGLVACVRALNPPTPKGEDT